MLASVREYRIRLITGGCSQFLAKQSLESPNTPFEEDARGLSPIGLGMSRLEILPVELLLGIADKLDDVSKLCLKNTSSLLRRVIKADFSRLSTCSK